MKRFFALIIVCLACWASAPQAQTTRFAYLAPVEGTGTRIDPFRARCHAVAGAGHVDLRPWGIARFLCTADALPSDMTSVLVIGSSLTATLNPAQRTALNALVGRTLSSNTVIDAVVEILSTRLRAGRDGKIKVFLGGTEPVYQQTAGIPFRDHGWFADAALSAVTIASLVERYTIGATAAYAASIAEDWNCADSASLTCDLTWTKFIGTSVSIFSNAAVLTGSGLSVARADSALDTDDMDVQATLSAMTRNGAGYVAGAVIGRKANNATATYYSYAAIFTSGSGNNYELFKVISGTYTSLGVDTTDPAVSHVMKLRTDGSSITGFLNGGTSIGPVTDTDITGNLYAGAEWDENTTPDSFCGLNDWSATDYTVPALGTSPARRRSS